MATSVGSIDLRRIVETKSRAFVLFSGEWCPDCREFEPIWSAWAKNRAADCYQVEVPRGGPEWSDWDLEEIPTVAAFLDGREVQRVHGIITREDLDALAARRGLR